MTSATLSSSGDGLTMDDPLRVELEVELPPDAGCALGGVDRPVRDVSQHLKRHDRDCQSDYGECHTEVTVDGEAGVRREYLRSAVGSGCVCLVFEHADCIPDIREVEDGTMTVSLILPDRGGLRDVIERVRETGATVRLRRAVHQADDGERTVEIDARDITPKQRQAIEVAVDEGYYDEPRAVDLDVLADRLGISKSAVSQRLNAVESKLVLSLTGD